MRSIRARLEDLEGRVVSPPGEYDDPREELLAKLDALAERQGPVAPEERPSPEEVEEILAKLRARAEALTGGGGGR